MGCCYALAKCKCVASMAQDEFTTGDGERKCINMGIGLDRAFGSQPLPLGRKKGVQAWSEAARLPRDHAS